MFKSVNSTMLKAGFYLAEGVSKARRILKNERGATFMEYVMLAVIVLVVGGAAFVAASPAMRARIGEYVNFISQSNFGAS